LKGYQLELDNGPALEEIPAEAGMTVDDLGMTPDDAGMALEDGETSLVPPVILLEVGVVAQEEDKESDELGVMSDE
jgi:hypothetical protein